MMPIGLSLADIESWSAELPGVGAVWQLLEPVPAFVFLAVVFEHPAANANTLTSTAPTPP